MSLEEYRHYVSNNENGLTKHLVLKGNPIEVVYYPNQLIKEDAENDQSNQTKDLAYFIVKYTPADTQNPSDSDLLTCKLISRQDTLLPIDAMKLPSLNEFSRGITVAYVFQKNDVKGESIEIVLISSDVNASVVFQKSALVKADKLEIIK